MVAHIRKSYIPEQGDLVWLEFNLQAGHEQAGLRPALIISPAAYNAKVGLALICPITSKVKGYPFEVVLPDKLKIKGAVLSDQIKNLDWQAREAKFIAKVPVDVLHDVVAKIKTIIAMPN